MVATCSNLLVINFSLSAHIEDNGILQEEAVGEKSVRFQYRLTNQKTDKYYLICT